MEGPGDGAVVGRSHDEEFCFYSKVLWGTRERLESRKCLDLIIVNNFLQAALCGKYCKWAEHRRK